MSWNNIIDRTLYEKLFELSPESAGSISDIMFDNGISLIKLTDGYVAFGEWDYIGMSIHIDTVAHGALIGSYTEHPCSHEDVSAFRAIAIVYFMMKGICWEDLCEQ